MRLKPTPLLSSTMCEKPPHTNIVAAPASVAISHLYNNFIRSSVDALAQLRAPQLCKTRSCRQASCNIQLIPNLSAKSPYVPKNSCLKGVVTLPPCESLKKSVSISSLLLQIRQRNKLFPCARFGPATSLPKIVTSSAARDPCRMLFFIASGNCPPAGE